MQRHILMMGALLGLLALPLDAQLAGAAGQNGAQAKPVNTVDEAFRQQRIALTGDVGAPQLPMVTADSPLDTIFYADRVDYRELADLPPLNEGSAGMSFASVPASETGTGFQEVYVYQLGSTYDEFGPPHPLIVAMHGYGGSANSPANQSSLDEEADARGYVYMAPTGLDDQIFGTPDCQRHVELAIQHMLDDFNIDPDRIYMVGFSMGGGIALNFASRYRDPDGVMIAAVGTVSAALDWTQTYNTNDASLQAWMENVMNFGGPPTLNPFRYQRSSALHMDVASYPPLPGTLDSVISMATNLGSTPIYLTYDDQDGIVTVPTLNEALDTLLQSVGATVQKTVQSGTQFPGPPTLPAPHSWHVLDEVELFAFLDGKTVNRLPVDFETQQDAAGTVSWVDTIQERANDFTYLDASAIPANSRITLENMVNLHEVTVDVGAAGITLMPVRVQVTNDQAMPVRVRLTGFSQTPSRLHDVASNGLITLVDSDPATGSLMLDVDAGSSIFVKVVHDPTWNTVLTISPDPAVLQGPVTFNIDGPDTSVAAYLVISDLEVFTPLNPNPVFMTAFPVDPAVIIGLPLDANGDATLNEVIPNDPMLEGIRLPTQVVTVDGLGALESVSNLWGFYIQ